MRESNWELLLKMRCSGERVVIVWIRDCKVGMSFFVREK